MRKALLKYVEVARTNLRSRWAYLWDQLLSTFHLIIIMFIFVQLWRVTYSAAPSSSFADYSLPEIVWYLVATEAIITSLPRIDQLLQNEVKDGDLAVRLNKPYNYLLFHYSSYVGDGLMRLCTQLLAGGLTAYLLVGGFDFRWEATGALLLIYLSTQVLHFFYGATIGLAAFWMEDVVGLWFIFDRVKWILGGFLLPVEIYPDGVRQVVELLPFRHMIAGPARLFVKFEWAAVGELLLSQGLWAMIFGLVCFGVYRLGVRRVDVNGG